MRSRIKEEERIEKIIQGLLKLPENRRCINCNSLGPQYVCTTFWTFVCTNCSGVHREFTHRVKSVSMAKFSAEEVSSLQAGGNERAREIYFKTWDPQIYPLPNDSNLMKLRNFIKHVYVERRFTGEKSSDKLAKLKKELKDGFFERSSYDRYSTGPRDEHNEKRSFSGSYPRGGHEPRSLRNFVEDRSLRYQENGSLHARRTRSCARFEIVDDRVHDDNYGNVRGHESHRFSGSLHRGVSLSPDLCKSSEITPWEVRSVKENCGDRITSLKLGDATKEKQKFHDNTQAEKAAETSSSASTNGKQEEQKEERSSSIIDTKVKADAEPESSDTSVSSNRHKIVPSSNGGNSSSLPSTQQNSPEKASKPKSVNSVEALLLELTAPVAVPVGNTSDVPSSVDALSATPAALPNGANTSETVPNMGNILSVSSSGGDSAVEVSNGKQLPETKQHQPSASLTVDSSSTEQSSLPIEASANQNLCPLPAPNLQAQALSNQLSWPSPASTSEAQTSSNQNSWPSPEPNSQTASNSQSAPNSEAPISLNSSSIQLSHVASRISPENSLTDASIPAARKALPADVFTSPYSLYPASVPYGQFRPAQQMGMGMGMQMGVGMQYNPSAVLAGLAGGSKSKNPFDIDDNAPQAQNPMFPYMVAMQGARPPLSAQMGLQSEPSPNAFALHHQQLPSYGTTISLGADLGQQPLNSMLVPRTEENSKTGDTEDVFAALNPLQSMSRSQANTKGGNPFG